MCQTFHLMFFKLVQIIIHGILTFYVTKKYENSLKSASFHEKNFVSDSTDLIFHFAGVQQKPF